MNYSKKAVPLSGIFVLIGLFSFLSLDAHADLPAHCYSDTVYSVDVAGINGADDYEYCYQVIPGTNPDFTYSRFYSRWTWADFN